MNIISFLILFLSASLVGKTPIFVPQSEKELVTYIQTTKQPISLFGAGYSQGGQTEGSGATQIKMDRIFCRITFLDLVKKQITVQANATWRQVQECIDPYNLSVSVMQSYNDFSIGGSIGVNVHGRDLAGQMITSIIELRILCADGSIVKASRQENYDLFCAAIGGYGLVGIILDVTLQLCDNVLVELVTDTVSKNEYKNFFENCIQSDKTIELYNAVIYPHDFSTLVNHSWKKTTKPVGVKDRLRPRKILHAKELLLEQLVRRVPFLHSARPSVEPKLCSPHMTVYRNYEMSHTVKSIEPLVDFVTTSILQEYFIPVAYFESFLLDLERIKKKYWINMMNISVRFLPANNESLLSYAPTDSFAFVLYMDVVHPRFGTLASTEQWTRDLIDAALSYGGTYYLPYALYATKEQFRQSYNRVDEFLAVKKKYDPQNRFVNSLWQKYMTC